MSVLLEGKWNMKKKRMISIIFTIVICISGCIAYSVYKMEYQNISINRIYSDMKSNLVIHKSANICVISETEHDDIAGYSIGASGVIFEKDDAGYYALTAYHVVNAENTKFLIMTVNDPTLKEYRESHPDMGITSTDEYYKQFPIAEIIYENEESDLAIIYFKSNQDLECATISSVNPQKGDRIVTVGTYSEKMDYFAESYGQVKQNKTITFHTDDGASDNQILKHSAFIAEGFSGSGAWNEDMEIVGMNIGGQRNILGRFSYGAMIPCEQINQCIIESGLFAK